MIKLTYKGGKIPAPRIGKRAPHIALWTRRGLARHAKILTTEQAWAIYERMEEVYFSVLESGRVQLDAAPKPLTFDGQRVWTIRQAAEHFGRTPRQIYKALSTKQFERGVDYFVTSGAELARLREENAMWIPLPIILILECGWSKLAARYRQIKETARAVMPSSLLELEERLKEQMKATAGVLKAFAEIKTALV